MNTQESENHSLQNKTWTLYILECGDHSLYTGITNRLSIRIENHQTGAGARYTRSRLPVKLLYTEEYSNRSEASKREYAVKKMSRNEKLELIHLGKLSRDQK